MSDAYRDGERETIREALNVLLDPSQPDWSPKGVYAYWDYDTHDLLYLGLASDLRSRFAQHNGLVHHSGGNKQKEIDAYFAGHELLGFSVLLQSKAVAIWEDLEKIDFTLGATAGEIIAFGEGQLIEVHRLVHGSWPPWNGVGGSTAGQKFATPAPALLDILAAHRSSLFVARHSLRAVASSIKFRFLEATIHGARIRAVMDAHEVAKIPEAAASGDRDEVMRLIQRSLLLRSGHIVQELDESDATIRNWLALLGDPEYWEAERERNRALLLDAASGTAFDEKAQQVADFLDPIISQGAPPSHIAATADLFETGYLGRVLELPEL
jgi:hypothetical protein